MFFDFETITVPQVNKTHKTRKNKTKQRQVGKKITLKTRTKNESCTPNDGQDYTSWFIKGGNTMV